MLRNVAIPLMLAASEAEAATKTQAEMRKERKMKEDMEQDRDPALMPILIADAAACTVASDTSLAQLNTKVKSELDLLNKQQ